MQFISMLLAILIIVLLIYVIGRFLVVIVKQNTVVVLTVFGKFQRTMQAGLNLKFPWEMRNRVISLQIQSQELKFQAITHDQAAVSFAARVLYRAKDGSSETAKAIAFKFATPRDFQQALFRLIEGEIRTLIAQEVQQDVLGIREKLSVELKTRVSEQADSWGYVVDDVQVTDLSFGEEVTRSMEKVVAATNEKRAAENSGEAVKVKMTKEAEAKSAAMRIEAEGEKEAWKLRGEGEAAFRQAIANGILESDKLLKENGISTSDLLQFTYLETIKYIAENGQGKIIFIDSGAGAANRMMHEFAATSAYLGGPPEA